MEEAVVFSFSTWQLCFVGLVIAFYWVIIFWCGVEVLKLIKEIVRHFKKNREVKK